MFSHIQILGNISSEYIIRNVFGDIIIKQSASLGVMPLKQDKFYFS